MGQNRSIAGSRMLITGASQGIGKALAEAAAARGAKVLVCARKIDLLQEVAQQIRAKGGVIEIVQADITSPEDRQKMVEAAEKAMGGLDILVNNAGIGATGHFADVGPERLRQMMEVNFFGLTETTRVFLPMLKKGNKPAIVNISSIAGKRGIPARSEYSASKFAVQGFSEALRAELAKDGVDVIVVSPGLTQTNFSENMIEQKALVQLDHLRGMSADDVAYYILRAIEKGHHETCLTFKGKMLALVARFFPWIADIVVKRKVRGLFQDEIEARKNPKPKGERGERLESKHLTPDPSPSVGEGR
jgi:short-subunit dehydrogenase